MRSCSAQTGLRSRLIGILEDPGLGLAAKEARINSLLGFDPTEPEKNIHDDNPDLYAGLPEEALSTPFEDYYRILRDLGPGDTLVDLGAGYGKGSLLCEAIGFDRACLSLELSSERVGYSKKIADIHGLNAQCFQRFDLRQQPLPPANAYFVYLPLGELVIRPIEALLKSKSSCVFYVAESHGDLIDFFLALPEWFELEKMMESRALRHRPGIYKFHFTPKTVSVSEPNGPGVIYYLVENWSGNPKIVIEKESGRVEVGANSLIPIKYNGQVALECLELKRIVDFERVRIASL